MHQAEGFDGPVQPKGTLFVLESLYRAHGAEVMSDYIMGRVRLGVGLRQAETPEEFATVLPAWRGCLLPPSTSRSSWRFCRPELKQGKSDSRYGRWFFGSSVSYFGVLRGFSGYLTWTHRTGDSIGAGILWEEGCSPDHEFAWEMFGS
jgi:hypothetical protein